MVPPCINIFKSIPRARVGTHVKKNVFVIGLIVLLKTRMGQMGGQGRVVEFSIFMDEKCNLN